MDRPTDSSPGRRVAVWFHSDRYRALSVMVIVLFTTLILPACRDIDSSRGEPWSLSAAEGDESRYATLFRLINRTDRPLRVQTEECEDNPSPPWLTLEFERTNAALSERWCACRCETLERRGPPCPVCDVECSEPVVELLEADEAVRWRWDGTTYVRDEIDGHRCTREELPERGTTLTAVFCWSENEGSVGRGKRHENRTCQSVPFDYGTRTTVELEVREH